MSQSSALPSIYTRRFSPPHPAAKDKETAFSSAAKAFFCVAGRNIYNAHDGHTQPPVPDHINSASASQHSPDVDNSSDEDEDEGDEDDDDDEGSNASSSDETYDYAPTSTNMIDIMIEASTRKPIYEKYVPHLDRYIPVNQTEIWSPSAFDRRNEVPAPMEGPSHPSSNTSRTTEEDLLLYIQGETCMEVADAEGYWGENIGPVVSESWPVCWSTCQWPRPKTHYRMRCDSNRTAYFCDTMG